ncbi:MAG: winged helix-turn-helix domain-containing protein [Bacteroidota bacterium]
MIDPRRERMVYLHDLPYVSFDYNIGHPFSPLIQVNDPYKIEIKFWISYNGKSLLGKGKMQLLRQIDRYGSLRQAAEELNLSYRKAYYMIYSMNKTAEQPIVEMKRGGKNGGLSELTPYGKWLILEFDKIEKQLDLFIHSINLTTE